MSKKIMGLPLPVWLGVAAAGLLLGIYLRHRGTQGSVGSQTAFPTSDPNAGLSTASGDIGSAISGGGVAPAGSGYDPSTEQALLQGLQGGIDQNTAAVGNLVDAIGALLYNVPSSAGSGSSAVGSSTSPNPGGPMILASSTPTKAKAVPKPATKAPAKSPAKIVYATYKKNVKLKAGQTIHYKKGKGYYAA